MQGWNRSNLLREQWRTGAYRCTTRFKQDVLEWCGNTRHQHLPCCACSPGNRGLLEWSSFTNKYLPSPSHHNDHCSGLRKSSLEWLRLRRTTCCYNHYYSKPSTGRLWAKHILERKLLRSHDHHNNWWQWRNDWIHHQHGLPG